MSDGVLIVAWLIGGTALAWFVLTRFERWMGARMAELDSASRSPDDERGNDLVRVWGFVVALAGLGMLFLGQGWAVWGVVPLQVFGGFSLAFGGWMFSFPAKYRELQARSRR